MNKFYCKLNIAELIQNSPPEISMDEVISIRDGVCCFQRPSVLVLNLDMQGCYPKGIGHLFNNVNRHVDCVR